MNSTSIPPFKVAVVIPTYQCHSVFISGILEYWILNKFLIFDSDRSGKKVAFLCP